MWDRRLKVSPQSPETQNGWILQDDVEVSQSGWAGGP